jgi:hypothetical protein
MKNATHMKKALAVVVLPLLFAAVSFAEEDFAGEDVAASGSVVTWSRVVGVITSPGISSKVAGFNSGTTPWTATNGSITVHSTGQVAFSVQGLVLVGGDASGTPGPVTSVKGTLVCNAGTSTQFAMDTPATPLSPQGNASFVGALSGPITSKCVPLFLIRVVPKNVWIATGAVRNIH